MLFSISIYGLYTVNFIHHTFLFIDKTKSINKMLAKHQSSLLSKDNAKIHYSTFAIF